MRWYGASNLVPTWVFCTCRSWISSKWIVRDLPQVSRWFDSDWAYKNMLFCQKLLLVVLIKQYAYDVASESRHRYYDPCHKIKIQTTTDKSTRIMTDLRTFTGNLGGKWAWTVFKKTWGVENWMNQKHPFKASLLCNTENWCKVWFFFLIGNFKFFPFCVWMFGFLLLHKIHNNTVPSPEFRLSLFYGIIRVPPAVVRIFTFCGL